MRSDSTSQESWSRLTRIGFRFGVIASGILFGPWFIGVHSRHHAAHARDRARPGIGSPHEFAEVVLGIELPPLVFTGSGDQLYHYVQLLLVVDPCGVRHACLVAAHEAAFASAARGGRDDRRALLPRGRDARLRHREAPARPVPAAVDRSLRRPIGDMSPMGLLWTFMGHSQPYTKLAGGAEVLGAVLLLSRRLYVHRRARDRDRDDERRRAELLLRRAGQAVLVGAAGHGDPARLATGAADHRRPHRSRCPRSAATRPWIDRGRAHSPRRKGHRRRPYRRSRVRARDDDSQLQPAARRAHSKACGASTASSSTASSGRPLFTDDTRWRKLIFARTLMQIRYGTDRRAGAPGRHRHEGADDHVHRG